MGPSDIIAEGEYHELVGWTLRKIPSTNPDFVRLCKQYLLPVTVPRGLVVFGGWVGADLRAAWVDVEIVNGARQLLVLGDMPQELLGELSSQLYTPGVDTIWTKTSGRTAIHLMTKLDFAYVNYDPEFTPREEQIPPGEIVLMRVMST